MSVRVEHLDFAFPRMPVLRDIDATAGAGRITAIIGPNAAGKSTLLRCVIGALSPQRGRVMIGDRVMHRISARSAAQLVAYVPQRATVSAAFTVRQVVELGRYALPANASKVDAAIARLDLEDLVERPYSALSVGQQQRVSLARALAQLSDDGALVLDEPSSAMDLRHTHDTMQLLRQTAHSGAAVLVAMHDLTLAASVADDVWLLNEGSLHSAGSSRNVLQPELLRQVFQVNFRWVEPPGSLPILTAISNGAAHDRDDALE